MEPFPATLAVYLSNQCNLACRRCYVAVNRGAPSRLSFDEFKKGLDYFLSKAKTSAAASVGKVSFFGGEPLLDYPLLRRAVEYVQSSAGDGLPMQVYTNGTLLGRDTLDFLRGRGVEIVLGLVGGGSASVGRRLARIDGRSRANLTANWTFTPGTVGSLVRVMDILYRDGLRKIAFFPDVTSLWSARDAARLKAALEGFARYYRALARCGAAPFEIGNIHDILAETASRRRQNFSPCPRLILAADGRFYACDKMLGLPMDRLAAWSIGSPEEGLDAGARGAYFQEATAAARAVLGSRRENGHCPVGVYSLWKLGLRPSEGPPVGDGLRTILESFGLVSEVFRGGLLSLAREFKDDPAFRRIHHLGPLVRNESGF